jgi:alpha-L-arabinofuranosidase
VPKALSFLLFFALLAGCAPAQTPFPSETASSLTPIDEPVATLPAPTAIPTAHPDILYVDPGLDLGPISPLVYGTNHGPWAGIPAARIEDVYNLPVTVIRFPGGEWGDRNSLRPHQIDQFMDLCQRIGATATINVRTMSGTPEEAAELVRYVNIEKGYGVRYWAIGNEPQFYEAALGEPYTAERFNREFRAIALAMKAVDPTIQIIGPELTRFGPDPAENPKDSEGKDWMIEFLRASGELVDVVSIHRYPFPENAVSPARSVDDLRQDTANWTPTLRYLRDLVQAETGRDLPIAVTETNSDWSKAVGGVATPDSHYNAIWWADSLGRMIRERVLLVNYWLISYNQGGWNLVARDGPSPTYYVYEVYKHFGEQLVYSASGVADVSIYAARRADGALTLVVINLSDEEKRVRLEVAGGAPTAASVIRLDPEHNAADLGMQSFLVDGFLSLPPQSVTLYVLPE